MQLNRKEYAIYMRNREQYNVVERRDIVRLFTDWDISSEMAKVMASNVIAEKEDLI